eukprot:m.79798 g.79798  ORF g.79798 m.79798 type:complete len:399 (-) comp8615_c5_seq3:1778-2974(-)
MSRLSSALFRRLRRTTEIDLFLFSPLLSTQAPHSHDHLHQLQHQQHQKLQMQRRLFSLTSGCMASSTPPPPSSSSTNTSGGVGWLSEEGRQIVDGDGQFGKFAVQYDTYRPSYPPSLWNRIFSFVTRTKSPHKPPPTLPKEDSKVSVADLGSGTGRGALALSTFSVVDCISVVEPDKEMLRICRQRFDERFKDQCSQLHSDKNMDSASTATSTTTTSTPHHCSVDVKFYEAPAEDTTIPTDTVDVAVCLQAWHWVDNTFGLIEVSRILELGGIFAVVWNDRNLESPLVAELEDLIESYNKDYNRSLRQCDKMHHLFNNSSTFVLEHCEDFNHDLILPSPGDVVALTNTFSYVKNVLSSSQLKEFSKKCLGIARKYESEENGTVSIPHICRLYLLRRVR